MIAGRAYVERHKQVVSIETSVLSRGGKLQILLLKNTSQTQNAGTKNPEPTMT